MKLIVGLGNHGDKYQHTRHNAGFDVIDLLAKELGVSIDQNKFKALIKMVDVDGEKVILMKPMTYMNLSGEAVSACIQFYKLELKDVLIIHDDLDLPVGKLRIRQRGSFGGQNGMRSIQSYLNSQEINRIRVGIGRSSVIDVSSWVLMKVSKEEQEEYQANLQRASQAARAFISKSMEEIMNRYNR
ncbi:aminoacyl-tRNA hydrolase [Erysipelotrichaceae bacterium OH741_COT-311]|nr:aminoacyl-tRNA hydrolase [Erysipelotrichaceae bacterium OH741_COT-311]